jgi:hypothetical protein
MTGTSYYVYYKVDAARVGELRRAVHGLFAAIERACGVRGRWLRRRDDPATYMEVYEGVLDEQAFEGVLAREGTKLGVQRRTEVFISGD